LQDNGGPTWTHALLTGSPAIDQGNRNAIPALASATDQRGQPRISDWPGVDKASDGSDIGAFEAQYVSPYSPYSGAYTFTTVAGRSSMGSADGVGSDAQFYQPVGVTMDRAGNLYVADSWDNVIRKITPAGVVTTIAGFAGSSGSADGTNSAARFNEPRGIAVDRAGNLYVADYYNYTIRKITPAGAVSTIAGLAGSYGSADGTNDTAQFSFPQGVAVDRAGNVYVADAGNCTIREITPAGTNWVVITIAGRVGWSGSADGLGTNAQFGGGYSMSVEGSMALAMDGATNLYVADTYNHTIRKLTPLGTNWMVSTIAGQPPQWMDFGGYADGTNGDARFYLPSGIVVDATTNLFVADCQNNALRRITPVGTNWVTGTLAGWPGPGGMADGTGTNAQFNAPEGVAVDTSAGTVFVADMYNNLIREITSAGVVTTLAGATSRGSADGAPQTARFNWPYGVAVGSSGNVYVADTYNHTIRKITSAGLVSTIAGLSGQSGSADGAGSNARFNGPGAVAVDAAGNLYVADMWNYTIRKITPAGMVSTIAGLAGQYGSDDGTNSAARFWGPLAITADSATNLYVADGDNTIRKITPVGANWVVKTIAGSALSSGQGSADGTNGAAQFNTPIGVAVDTAGRVYVADIYNYTIRQITPVGPNWVVTTIAGSAGHYGSADGTGANASFTQPYGIAVDRAGNLYVTAFYTIRKITPVGTDWVVSTIGGLNGSPGAADGAGSAARFYNACGIALDAAGNLYIADTDNNTIRKGVLTAYGTANLQAYAQPPMSGQLVVTLLPPEANGQWRFPWELAWRNSGDTAGNLVPGNYTVECRNAPGWLAIPLPAFPIPGGATTFVTNQYYPTSNFLGTTNTGSLTVNIGPTVPGGAGWRFLGEGAWRPPGSTAANLLPDTYAIEFEPVSGYSKPASQAVQVSAGTTTAILASYLLAQSAPSGVCLPAPVPTNSINDLADYPYGFNGQLQSDLGYGSGVAVQTNVVLTAAHLVFNDQTLSYVSQVYWWFRQEANVFMPQPQAARGWYLLSGYAAQRTNDLLGGFAPEQSSPQSRNLDAAALYFPSPVAGGGCGGYLSSDATPNSWLTSISQKLLVGYPVDGSSLGDASILPGTMYQTGPQPYPLSLATDPVSDQQVYLAQWFLSYPGNSGGPFYVQYNGYYYPAGVYLGTLYNGVVPYASLVRGIDSNVVNLITSAQLLGDSGTNYTGGGVITITAGGSAGQLAYVQVDIEPAAAVAAGAAWRLQGAGTWNPTTPFTITVAPGSPATIEFQQIPGWAQPSSSSQQVTAGQLTTISATYTVIPAQLGVSPTSGFAASGFAGGPFNPSSTTYTLTNSGGASLNWSASKSAAWLSLSASNGTLAAGAKTNVTVSLNANANSLIASNYSAVVGFTNLTGGRGNTNRAVSLNVLVHPSVLLTNLQVLANGSLAMRLQGVTNRVYSILGTTNLLQPLTNWLEVLRLTNTAGQTTFTNPLPSTTPQYYRANEL
ncbi:MAG TPA: SBBP repeat-containing protein, partial [Candidatus Acidoferrum sp.]|nr:SBBP repeat-containing protein [Candidatus Acidoferrum sp.]